MTTLDDEAYPGFPDGHNTRVWRNWLDELIRHGHHQAPRGMGVKAIYNKTLVFDPVRPIIMPVGRRLSYRFMFAEAHWILSGSDRVEDIAPYNKHIAQFSDDGVTYFGAYGPKILQQVPYVVNALNKDQDTRQAIINIWRESPPPTKDVPCTLNAQFRIEHGWSEPVLHSTVVMRSSDAWLGLPYDIFNFSMLQRTIANGVGAQPGVLVYFLMNGHLYDRDEDTAEEIVIAGKDIPPQPGFYAGNQYLLPWLAHCRDAKKPLDEWCNGGFDDVQSAE